MLHLLALPKFLLLGMFGWKYDKELPQHYRDALRDYAMPAGGEELLLNMDTLKQEYQRMVKLEAEHPEYHVRSNYIRRYFGKTFWWYFIYGEQRGWILIYARHVMDDNKNVLILKKNTKMFAC